MRPQVAWSFGEGAFAPSPNNGALPGYETARISVLEMLPATIT